MIFSRFLKNSFKVILCLLVVLVAISYFLLQNSDFWCGALRYVLSRELNTSEDLLKVDLDAVDINTDGSGTFEGLAISWSDVKPPLKVNIQRLQLNCLIEKWLNIKQVIIDVEGVRVEGANVESIGISGGVAFKGFDQKHIVYEGVIQVPQMTLDKKILFEDVFVVVAGDEIQTELSSIRLNVFGGECKGNIVLDYKNKLHYIVNAHLYGLQSSKLQVVHKPILSYVRGAIDGEIVLEGRERKISHLQAKLSMAKDSLVKASLFKYLIEYIPEKTVQRKALEKVIGKNGYIGVDQFEVISQNRGSSKIENEFKVKSYKYYLDIDLKLDTQFDENLGRLVNLSQYYKHLIGMSQ